MYTLLPTFVEMHLKMTTLYRFNHKNPILQLRRIGCKRTVLSSLKRTNGLQTPPDLNLLDHHV